MRTESSARGLLTDDRGAIMVMGIFMCSCLVAALWYLAGIGDAILYRERMQEAADAVAFSDAALHARGMNLVVLINLVMAVVLSVRVAIRVAKLVMTVAAAIFAAAGFLVPALWAAVPPTTEAAVVLDDVDTSIKEPMDATLRGLNSAQDGIITATPPLADLAATQSVASKYEVVDQATTIAPGTELPLAKGAPGKLCKEAASVLKEINAWLFTMVGLGGLREATDRIGDLMAALVSTSTDYFCDLEKGKDAPKDKADQFDQAAADRCQNLDGNGEARRVDDAEKNWEKKCAEFGVICMGKDANGKALEHGVQTGAVSGPDPLKNQQELDRLRLVRDQAVRSLRAFAINLPRYVLNRGLCIQAAIDEMKTEKRELDELKQQQHLARPAAPAGPAQPQQPAPAGQPAQGDQDSSDSSGIAPMATKDFVNGGARGQFIAGIKGHHERLRIASKIVRLGAFHDKRTRALKDTDGALMPAWAQAEMFYDCGGTWNDKSCNSDDDAMWHFKWRARLRRFNRPADETLADLSSQLGTPAPSGGHERFADDLAAAVRAPEAMKDKPNKALRIDLANALHDDRTRTHGVH
jgi:hypothetical protein